MSMNKRVTEQVQKMADAYGTAHYDEEMEKYWRIFEEEYGKDEWAFSWAVWEDPTDALEESLMGDDNVNFVAELLDDYIRFWDIVEKLDEGKAFQHHRNDDLVARARKYVRENV